MIEIIEVTPRDGRDLVVRQVQSRGVLHFAESSVGDVNDSEVLEVYLDVVDRLHGVRVLEGHVLQNGASGETDVYVIVHSTLNRRVFARRRTDENHQRR